MKKLFVLCFLILTFPFFNALLFTPSIKGELTLGNPNRQVSFVAKRMMYSDYQFFENGVIRVNKGIYGYLFGSLYIVYYSKTYGYVPDNIEILNQYKIDFQNKGRTFVVTSIRRLHSSEDQAVYRIKYPTDSGIYLYSKGTIETQLPLLPNEN